MLYFKTIEPGTLSLLKKLMAIDELKQFNLVGGTALSLQYGNRVSIDLDLFTTEQFSYPTIIACLKREFGDSFEYEGKESNFGVFCFINSIKVDIINYRHPQIDNTIVEDNIRMYSTRDISAMKIQAILGRAKKKDFWDIAELLQHYSLNEMIEFHKKKYPSQQLLISIPQVLVYFDDAEESEDPISLKGQTWQGIKKILQQKVSDFLR
jgi:predicted nucleotidyltransferase component of viral defense system